MSDSSLTTLNAAGSGDGPEESTEVQAPRSSRRMRSRRRTGGRVATLLGVAVLLIWTLVPLLWALLSSFKDPLEIYEGGVLPDTWDPEGWLLAVSWPGFDRFLYNSMFLAVVSTVVSVAVSALAAYAFSRYAFRFRHALLLLVLIPRLVPRVSLIVPLYEMLVAAGLLDTLFALVLLYTASAVPLVTWVLVGFFGAVPKELEEAASIDGASTFQRLWRIVLPLAAPGMVTVSVLAFRESWNEFPFVLAFTQGAESRTLPYQLFLMQDAVGFQDWSLINAFALLTIIPILVLYLAFEKHVVSGLTAGALK